MCRLEHNRRNQCRPVTAAAGGRSVRKMACSNGTCALSDPQERSRKRAVVQNSILGIVLVVLIGAPTYPYLGFIVPLVMVIGMVGGFFQGRWTCGWICPRGAFLGQLLTRFSLHRPMPKALRGYVFRWIMFAALMGFMVYRLSLNPGSPEHWGRVFWLMCMVTTGIGVVLGALYAPRTWCSFCPVGTFASTVGGHKGVLQIAPECKQCKLCEKACPMHLEIAKDAPVGHLMSKDCIRCGACITACPFGVLTFAQNGNGTSSDEAQ